MAGLSPDTQRITPTCVGKSKDGDFILLWTHSEDVYDKAMTLPRAKYDKTTQGVKISDKYFKEMLDFAEQENFKFTEYAKVHIDELKSGKLEVMPSAKKVSETTSENVPNDINKILEDLRDED